uniref:Uncharacterized protein n=1 Tax=Tanacetum cinerariifolium TaxID=118510 RepID=A0A699GF30_TANCI|nr:hypothetical protein [Tanacetum cinerariifolium]
MTAVAWMVPILRTRELAGVGGVADGAHQFGFHRQLAVDRADRLVLPDAARVAQDFDVHFELVARTDRALEARAVDAHEIHHRVFIGRHARGLERQQRGRLRHRFDHQHARHHRLVREVAVEEFFVDGDVLDGGDELAFFVREHAVHQQQRVAMRQRAHLVADGRQVAHDGRRLFPVGVLGMRVVTRVVARFGERARDHGGRADVRVVRDVDMSIDHGGAAERAVFAHRGAAGHAHAAGHGRVRADVAVVGDLDQVVELDAVLDHGVGQRAAVHGGVGADVHIVAHHHAARLRDAHIHALVVGKAETVGADHGARVDDAALADDAARVERHVGKKVRAVAHLGVAADVAAGVDHRMLADRGARFDHHLGTDMGGCRHGGAVVHERGRMHAGRRHVGRQRLEVLRRTGKIHIGVGDDDARARVAGGDELVVGAGDDQRCGLAGQRLGAQLAIAEKADVRNAGGIQWGDPGHFQHLFGDVDAFAGPYGILQHDVEPFGIGHLADDLGGAVRDGLAFLVGALAQVFAELALAALILFIEIEHVALALDALRFGQRRRFAFELVGRGLQAPFHFLHGFFARLEFFLQFLASQLGQLGLVVDTLRAQPGDTRQRVFKLFLRINICADDGSGSEPATHLELEAFQAVARLGIDRLSITQLQRAHRRNPADAQAGRIAQLRVAHLFAFLVHLAGVEETEPAQAAVLAGARERQLQLGVADQARGAAQRIAVARVDRAQRRTFVAAHGTDTATVEVLEHRVRRVAQAAAVVDLALERKHGLPDHRLVVLLLVDGAVVLLLADHVQLQVQALVAADARRQARVAAVARPCQRQRHGIALGLADTAGVAGNVGHVLQEAGRRRRIGFDRRALQAHAEEHGVHFRERHAEAHASALLLDRVAADVQCRRTLGAQVHLVRPRNAVVRVVRVDLRERNRAAVLGRVQFHADGGARTGKVGLLDRGLEREFFRLRERAADGEVTGRLFHHGQVDVDLVGRALRFRRVDGDILEVAEAVDAVARQLDLVGVVPRRFELAEFAADHFVARRRVAGNIHVTHVRALARIDEEREAHFALLAVDVRVGVDVGKRVAERAQAIGDQLVGGRQQFARIHIALAQQHQRAQLVLAAERLAFELDVGDVVLLAFGDVDGDVNVFFIGRDRDLGGIDIHLDITAIEIIRFERLDIAGQLGLGILVRLGVPVEPAARIERQLVLEFLVREYLVADDIDLFDLGDFAFVHRERDVDAVAFQRRDGGHELDAVQAARQVLALEFLLGAVNRRLVEDLRFAHADVLERLDQHVLLEFLGARELHLGNGRTFLDQHHQHVAVRFQAHVLEEAGGVQRADGGHALVVVEGLAHAYRQVAEDRTGFRPLYALDADVLDHEGNGNRQQIHDPQTDADEGNEAQITDRAHACGLAGIVRNCNRAGDILERRFARDHLADHLERHGAGVPHPLACFGHCRQRPRGHGDHIRLQSDVSADLTDCYSFFACICLGRFRLRRHRQRARHAGAHHVHLHCLAGRGADDVDERHAVRHRHAVHAFQQVTRLQARAFGRAARQHLPHHGRWTGQADAELADDVAFQVEPGHGGGRQHRVHAAVTGTLHRQLRILLVDGRLHQVPAQFGPGRHWLAVDGGDRVARAQAGQRGRGSRRAGRRGRHADLAGRLFHAVHVQPGKQHDRHQEVGDRAGRHDGDALPHALAPARPTRPTRSGRGRSGATTRPCPSLPKSAALSHRTSAPPGSGPARGSRSASPGRRQTPGWWKGNSSADSCDGLLRCHAGGGVLRHHDLDAVGRAMGQFVHDPGDHAVDLAEADAAVEKRLHGHFVGRVEQGRRRAAGAQRVERQRQAGKALVVGTLELQRGDLGNVELSHAGCDPFRVRQRVSDRRAHVGVAQLRQHGPVDVRHHRMDHRLRVDHDLDAVGRGAEQPVGLDHFQALVHHGGGIDRNLAAHRPVRMFARLLGRHVFQRGDVAREEWPAGCGEQDLGHAGRRVAHGRHAAAKLRHRLEDGVVFAIDGQQDGAGFGHGVHEQLAGHDQRFLVRQQDFLAGAGGGQRGRQARGADDGSHHAVDFGSRRNRAQRGFAVFHFRGNAGGAQQAGQARGSVGRAHHGARGTEGNALGRQFVDAAVRGQGINGVALRVTGEHVQRGHADRTGGAKDGDALHKHAAVAGQQVAAVLHGRAALELGFEQVANDGCGHDHQQRQQRQRPAEARLQAHGKRILQPWRAAGGQDRDRCDDQHGNAAADRAFPRFTGGDGGRQLALAKGLAREIRADIGNPHQHQHRQQVHGRMQVQADDGKEAHEHGKAEGQRHRPVGRAAQRRQAQRQRGRIADQPEQGGHGVQRRHGAGLGLVHQRHEQQRANDADHARSAVLQTEQAGALPHGGAQEQRDNHGKGREILEEQDRQQHRQQDQSGGDGLVEAFDGKIGPVGVGEEQLGVRELPQQEIGNALFAAGADEQVGLGRIGHGQVRRQLLFGKVGGARMRGHHLGDGLHDVPAAAVVGADGDGQARVVGGLALGAGNHGAQLVVKAGQVAHHAQADIIGVHLGHFALERRHEQAHQQRHLFFGAAPVFRAEGKQGQVFDAAIDARLDHLADGFHPFDVPCHARQEAFGGPAAVAIHNHGDMARHLWRVRNLGSGTRIFHESFAAKV